MDSLHKINTNTLHGTVLRTSSPRIRNYADSDGKTGVLRTSSPRIRNYTDSDGKTGTGGNFQPSHAAPNHICMAQVIIQ